MNLHSAFGAGLEWMTLFRGSRVEWRQSSPEECLWLVVVCLWARRASFEGEASSCEQRALCGELRAESFLQQASRTENRIIHFFWPARPQARQASRTGAKMRPIGSRRLANGRLMIVHVALSLSLCGPHCARPILPAAVQRGQWLPYATELAAGGPPPPPSGRPNRQRVAAARQLAPKVSPATRGSFWAPCRRYST